jgi:urea transport system ATP-binding protein
VLVEQYFDFAVGLADEVTVMTRGEVSFRTDSAKADREKLLAAVSI